MNFLIFKARSINDEDNHFKLALRSKDIDYVEGGGDDCYITTTNGRKYRIEELLVDVVARINLFIKQ